MVIDTSKLKVSTKSIFAFFVGFGGLMQVPAVNQFVTALTMHHEKVSALVSALVGISLLLHNPEVRDALGVTEGEK